MLEKLILLLILIVFAGCQASGGGASGGGIIAGHTEVANKFTLTTTTNFNYGDGQTINLFLTFPLDVTVTGTPKLSLTIGSTPVDADFVSVSGKVLTFAYQVQVTDLDSDGISVDSTVNLNGGTLKFNGSENCGTSIILPDLSNVRVNGPAGAAPVAANITLSSFNEEASSTITLSYTDPNGDLATTCSVAGLSKVTITSACACAAGVCTVGVTGSLNQTGTAGFTYNVTAGGQTSNTAIASFTLNNLPDAPVAANFTPPAFNEDTQSIITLSYTDPESDLASSCSIAGLTNVTVSQACACAAGVCTVGVTGTANYTGAASFTYTVTANGLTSNSATASFNISPVNDAPVATNITPAAFNEDVQSIITLAYTDTESNLASTCALSGLSNVTVTQACGCAAGVCTVGVTGTSNYFGAGSFNYTVTAASQTSNSASATLTINAVDDAPVGNNLTPAAFSKNTQSVITLTYSDVENDLATTCSVAALTNVTATQACACAAGVCTVGVTGTLNYSGAASFTYTVTANGLTSASRTATLTVLAGSAPVANAITPAAFNEDTASVITLSYTDADGEQATSCSVTGQTNVTETTACACAAGVCTVGVTGTTDYNGAGGSFSYTVTAAGDVSNSATATLSITAVDDAPVATNITPAAFLKNAQSIITLAYTDVENDQATSCSISALSNVTITQACACAAGTCTVGVTGTLNYSGAASFNYTVTANTLASNAATATLTINSTPPVTTNMSPVAFNEDTQSVITLAYTDADLDQASSCATSSLTNVTVTQACACAAGVCTVGVTGTSNYFGAGASFAFTVTAGSDTSNSSTATLSVTAVDDAPVSTNITPAAFGKNTQSIITLAYTDVESHLATTCSVIGETNVTETQACACAAGVCTVGVTGTLNYSGAASFTYTVTANGLASNSSTATLSITNTAPVANAISPAAFDEDTQSIITLSYSDVDSDQATTCSVSGLSNVTATQACACAAGVCTVGVTGLSNYNGVASFNYTVTAAGQVSNSAASTLSITAVDDKPTGVPLTPGAFNEDTQSIITLTWSDVEGHNATACAATGLTNVTVTQACSCTLGTCTIGVTGTTHYNGVASFNYTVTANGLTSDAQPVNLTISSVSDAPTTANLTPAAFNEDTQSIITLTHTVVGGDTATSCSVTGEVNVTETQLCSCSAGVCTVGVTGTAHYNGSASFTWTVTAGTATSTGRTANLTINPVDDAAALGAITAKTTTVNTATTAIAFTFTDNDGAVCSAARLSMSSSNTGVVANGSVVWGGTAPNCTATITPVSETSGSANITITATDGGLASKTTVFSLAVNGAVLRWTNGSDVDAPTYGYGNPGGNTNVVFRVRNYGNAASGTVTIVQANASDRISNTTTTCAAIAAGSFCSATIRWTETGGGNAGLNTDTITATHASGASTDAITVTGTK